MKIRRVAIVGGTHGNEFTGVYLVKKFAQFPDLITRASFETVTLLANPKAFNAVLRYIDKDLNRCFLQKDLLDSTKNSYEEMLAKSIYKILGLKGDKQADLIFDLHTTTANMGLTLILSNNHPFNLKLAAYLSHINPLVRVYRTSIDSAQSNPYLNSLCELGFAIEAGPIAHGVLSATVFQKMEELICTILDYLENLNSGNIQSNNQTLTLYKYLLDVDYPRNEDGTVRAMVHPELQDRDYQALDPGEPMFLSFDGTTIAYEGESTVYPIFINSAAYSQERIAMYLTQKQRINV
ncbi:aspartoacylase [Scytonema sp. PCC 10023]|uniref:aspartoacylase n=1 Tax=Scytonema sp. PCC 10023 TaxID=1680591 RepID=UPI0039C75E2A